LIALRKAASSFYCLLIAALITVERLDHIILKPQQLDGVVPSLAWASTLRARALKISKSLSAFSILRSSEVSISKSLSAFSILRSSEVSMAFRVRTRLVRVPAADGQRTSSVRPDAWVRVSFAVTPHQARCNSPQ
jgi:hypothetical protein